MRKNFILIPGLIATFLFFFSGLNASHLDGLWRNDRQNITMRIEQDNNGFRAKRIDQGIWYKYTAENDYVFVDRNGNWYEVIDDDELEWNEASSNKRIVFRRIDDARDAGQWNDHSDNDRWDRDDDRWNRDEDGWDNTNGTDRINVIDGRWYDRSTKDRLEIEAVNGGYRVRTQHSAWEKYVADRRGNQLRSSSGNTIQLIDRNTIRWRSYQGRHEHIYVRQGNGNNNGRNNGHRVDHQQGHRGHKSCG